MDLQPLRTSLRSRAQALKRVAKGQEVDNPRFQQIPTTTDRA